MHTIINCIIQGHFHQWYGLQPTQPMLVPKSSYNLLNGLVVPHYLTISVRVKAEETTVLQPKIFHSSFQKAAVNLGSRSWSTARGTPYKCPTCTKNNLATAGALNSFSPALYGISQHNLPNLSMQTKSALYPLMSGNPVIKSMVQYSNLLCGIGNGCSRPAGA